MKTCRTSNFRWAFLAGVATGLSLVAGLAWTWRVELTQGFWEFQAIQLKAEILRDRAAASSKPDPARPTP